MTRAVVFGYHNVGCRCLSALLAHQVEVPLVVTHTDDPDETIWFDSMRGLASQHRIPAITPGDPNRPEIMAQVRALAPDFLFSFYYRHMLKPPWLTVAPRGTLNLHGSLLPRYRGRAPVNWAVISGESTTGATLHYMTEKPDAGDIVDQQAVAILPEDTALDVFQKVVAAAATVVDRSLPLLLAGTAPRRPQNLALGSYFGARRPEDGRIDWLQPAAQVHNLVRGVAPPYPGAFTEIGGMRLRILRTRLVPERAGAGDRPRLFVADGACFAACAGGGMLQVLAMELAGAPLTAAELAARFGAKSISLEAAL